MTVRIPDRLPAAPGDLGAAAMTPMFDMVLGTSLTFDDRLDADTLRRAVRLLLDAEPVLGSWLHEGILSGNWVRCSNLDDNVPFKVVSTENPYADCAAFHAQPFAPHGPRLDIRLLRARGQDVLCLKVDHLVADGWATKKVTYTLADIYSRLLADPSYLPTPNLAPRPTLQDVWDSLSAEQQTAAMKAPRSVAPRWKMSTRLGTQAGFAVRTLTIEPGRTLALRDYAVYRRATVNDVLLAGLLRALAAVFPLNGSPPCVSITADTRRFVQRDEFERICLLATTQTIEIPYRPTDSFDETLLATSEVTQACKKSLWSTRTYLTSVPHRLLRNVYRMAAALMRHTDTACPVVMNIGVLDESSLLFGSACPVEAYVCGPIAHVPGFPLTISLYRNAITCWVGFDEHQMNPRLVEDVLLRMEQELPRIRPRTR